MGVIIYPCKIKERVGDLREGNEREDLFEEYTNNGEDVLYMLHSDLSEPFGTGFYTYDCGNTHLSMSYGTNWDLFCCLEDIDDELEQSGCFTTFLNAHDIDNSISYTIADKMLNEFETHKEAVNRYIHKRMSDEYGDFLWHNYLLYIAVLKECVEIKGAVRYH